MIPNDAELHLPIPPLDLNVAQGLAGVSWAVIAAAAIYSLDEWRRGVRTACAA